MRVALQLLKHFVASDSAFLLIQIFLKRRLSNFISNDRGVSGYQKAIDSLGEQKGYSAPSQVVLFI